MPRKRHSRFIGTFARLPAGLRRSRFVFFVSIALTLFLVAAVFIAGIRKIPEQPIWSGDPTFNAKNAFEWTRRLAKDYPNRVPWRPERAAAAKYLKGELRKLGFEPLTIAFDEVIGGKNVTGLEDIFAILPGTELKNEYVVVLAHYDITDTTVEGAADDASGVGTVLELARIFKQGPAPRRNIVFLMTDSEEFGAFWGAHNFVQRFEHADKIVAAVSLDFVAPDEQKDILVLVDGLKSGYAPLWLRELAMDSIRKVPYAADDTRHILEFVQRAILIPPADHGAFLYAGIPAVNLFGRSTDFTHEMGAIHHTPEDNMSHLRLESFVPYGKSAEILLRSIDSMPEPLNGPARKTSEYWKLSRRYYLAGPASLLIHFLLFVPFMVYVMLLIHALKRSGRQRIWRVVKSEAKGFTLVLTSLLAGYGLLRVLPDLKVITKYEMFPATQKSLILDKPEYLAFGLVFLLVGTLYFLLVRAFRHRTDRASRNPFDIHVRHSLLGCILGLVILLAFLKNSYLGTLLLLPPAYLWMFMKNNRRFDSRMLNALLLLGGLVSFVAICLAMTMVFHVGIFYWYMFLAVSYGLISVYAAILAFAVIAVGIRILRNSVL